MRYKIGRWAYIKNRAHHFECALRLAEHQAVISRSVNFIHDDCHDNFYAVCPQRSFDPFVVTFVDDDHFMMPCGIKWHKNMLAFAQEDSRCQERRRPIRLANSIPLPQDQQQSEYTRRHAAIKERATMELKNALSKL